MIPASDVQSVCEDVWYDSYEYRNEDDDVSWMFDICSALYMFARVRGDSYIMRRLAKECQFSPGLSLRRADPPSLEELAEEEPMVVQFFEQLCELNPVEVN